MKLKFLCPVCDKPMETFHETMEGGITTEDGGVCDNGHYAFEYSYGTSYIKVGDREYAYGYDVSDREYWHIQRTIRKAIKQERIYWAKGNPKKGRGIRLAWDRLPTYPW